MSNRASFTIAQVCAALGDDLIEAVEGTAAGFEGVTNDSRVAQPGELFVALRTEVRDGHDYVPDAIARGVAGVMVESDASLAGAPRPYWTFRVRDTRHALGELARAYRDRFLHLRTIVITGNTGKTSTKELTAAVLGREFTVLKSPSNFNDEVGLSMTLFQADETHQRAVLEIGMDRPHELARDCEIARPSVGVVLNVGPTHLSKLGSMEAIAAAKAEAVEGLGEHGTAVLNNDDPWVKEMASKTKARVLSFGTSPGSFVHASDIRPKGLSGVDFTLSMGGHAVQTHSPLPGADLVSNALAAVTVGIAEGMSVEDAAHALSVAQVPARLQAKVGLSGATILDDCYNASPASMLAALEVLSETPGRRLALLGDMLELGSAEDEGHRRVGEEAARVVDGLFTIGQLGALIAASAMRSGARFVRHFDSKEEAVAGLREVLEPGDVLLIKASHGIGLETVVAELVA